MPLSKQAVWLEHSGLIAKQNPQRATVKLTARLIHHVLNLSSLVKKFQPLKFGERLRVFELNMI